MLKSICFSQCLLATLILPVLCGCGSSKPPAAASNPYASEFDSEPQQPAAPQPPAPPVNRRPPVTRPPVTTQPQASPPPKVVRNEPPPVVPQDPASTTTANTAQPPSNPVLDVDPSTLETSWTPVRTPFKPRLDSPMMEASPKNKTSIWAEAVQISFAGLSHPTPFQSSTKFRPRPNSM